MNNKKSPPNKPTVQEISSSPAPNAVPNGFQLLSKYRGAIMGIAALWILAFHEWIQLTTTVEGGFHPVNFLERYIKAIGFCGVDIFLMLSGIGLTFAIGKGSLLSFYYRRLKRILLPFLVVAIVRKFLEQWSMQNFIGNITGWRFYTESMYTFLWFVPAIVTLYLLFPFYYKLFSAAKNKVFFTVSVIEIWLLVTLLVRDHMRNDLFGFTNRIPVFVIGILFGWMTKNRKEMVFTVQTWIHIAITAALGLYLAYLADFLGYGLIVPVSNCCIPNCLIAISLPFLIAKGLYFLEQKAKRFGSILYKVLAFFGGFSLEIYCLQEWYAGKVMPGMRDKGWTNLGINLMYFIQVTLISFVASIAFKYFWKLVEMPFKRRKES